MRKQVPRSWKKFCAATAKSVCLSGTWVTGTQRETEEEEEQQRGRAIRSKREAGNRPWKVPAGHIKESGLHLEGNGGSR